MEAARARLQEIADLQNALPNRRAEAVAAARAAGMKWQDIADIFGITVHGLIKAQKNWEQNK